MLLGYRILAAALDELHEAADYVEQERPGFGLKLLDQFEAVVDFILEQPSAGTPVKLDVPRFEFRRFQMQRFPYSIFTARHKDEIVVFAVSHHKRAPDHWAHRLDDL